MGFPRSVTLRVQPPIPLDDITVLPAALTGRPEADMAHAMAVALANIEVPTASAALKRLRQAFPQSPLSARVAALGVMMERVRRTFDL